MTPKSKSLTVFTNVADSLLDDNTPFPPRYLHFFSDINPTDLETLSKIWAQINTNRKVALLKDLEELSEADPLLSFDEVGRLALKDNDPFVRAAGINLLWECEDLDLVPVYLQMMKKDSVIQVRSAAATALGPYVLRGELEEIPAKISTQIVEKLLNIIRGSGPPELKQPALESIGYSSNEEVPQLIQDAYNTGRKDWIISALLAMGRSADQQFEKNILECLKHPDTEIQFEAVRAAGELELPSARQVLLDLLDEGEQLDDDIRIAIIKSLSNIGGEGVKEALISQLELTEDEDETDFITERLDYLTFIEDQDLYNLYDINIQDENNLFRIEEIHEEDHDKPADDDA